MATTSWPIRSSSTAVGSQHHAPWNPPCTITNLMRAPSNRSAHGCPDQNCWTTTRPGPILAADAGLWSAPTEGGTMDLGLGGAYAVVQGGTQGMGRAAAQC